MRCLSDFIAGLNFKTVWNTSNALTSEIAWAPKNVKGLKFTQSDLATTSRLDLDSNPESNLSPTLRDRFS
jgi:hypothetical protein